MNSTSHRARPSENASRLTPEERLARFVELQNRAMQLLKASPEGYRQFWERNLRQRRIHAQY
jgi:hypothetical protein